MKRSRSEQKTAQHSCLVDSLSSASTFVSPIIDPHLNRPVSDIWFRYWSLLDCICFSPRRIDTCQPRSSLSFSAITRTTRRLWRTRSAFKHPTSIQLPLRVALLSLPANFKVRNVKKASSSAHTIAIHRSFKREILPFTSHWSSAASLLPAFCCKHPV